MKQIESGAPADAFVPVDLKWMDYDVEKKVTGGEFTKAIWR
jgi:ABC-type molybdate transport system substrate-binding protein